MPRPKKNLKPDDYLKLEAMASVGASIASIAVQLGSNSRTLRRILERDPRAKEAFERGRGAMESELVGALYRKAIDPENKNPVPAIFLLKTMRGFIDTPQPKPEESRVRVELILPRALTPEQYRRVLDVTPQKALQKAGVETDAA